MPTMSELIIDNPSQPIPVPNESARGAVFAGVAVLAVFFLGFGGWAAIAPLNGAAIAPAVIKVEGNRKTIRRRYRQGIAGQRRRLGRSRPNTDRARRDPTARCARCAGAAIGHVARRG